MTVLLHWCELLILWAAVGTILTAIYAGVNLLCDKMGVGDEAGDL